ncbi:endonuclease domain-containing protein [Spirosoma rhododendri]|uniref:Endonuclease domain-containing protein n=1 Tax=Spirosoma rhododendri TaxID=2728024 RepID=A0A7L5DRA9_9BACT|nr:endonuclease domain-containing protein [Spirosoma rhododendri]QJD80665.1 endonuclease domain-containing protein [Spirosoma rhododendri]
MKELRRELRQRQTEAETILWGLLRDRKVVGAKFRRQHSFGYFIVDFYCQAYRLVIELDGSVHNSPEARLADEEREGVLRDLGVLVIRFSNDEVLYDVNHVLEKIREILV